jgi:NDP-sugar pyrophosphorylase family protein
MKAMILVAGEGLRARPLTNHYAKPALPIPGGTILTHLINQLRGCGISEIALNLHYLPQTIMDSLERFPVWNVRISPFDEPVLAGSGGGFYRIRDFFDGQSFLILNGDTITDADLCLMLNFHNESGSLVTFLAKPDHSGSSRVLDTDKAGNVVAIRKQPEGHSGCMNYKFCGAMMIRYEIFEFFPDREVIDFFDDVLIPLLRNRPSIGKIYTPEFKWLEFGTPADYFRSCYAYMHDFLPSSESSSEFMQTGSNWIHKETGITSSADISASLIDRGSRIGNSAQIRNSIIFNSFISDNVHLDNSIVIADFLPENFSCRDGIVLPCLEIVHA